MNSSIRDEDIKKIFTNIKLTNEPTNIPFPQADEFSRIIDLLNELSKRDLSKEDITQYCKFVKRQTDYYSNALIYLGLAEKFTGNKGVSIKISKLGQEVNNRVSNEKYLLLVERILRHKPFYDVYKFYNEKGTIPTNEKISEMMKQYNLNIDKTTVNRRALTVSSWIKWIIDLSKIKLF